MGYAPDYFAGTVAKWIDKGWLPLDGRIVEFGAQEFYCDQDEARSATAKFLRSRGIEEAAIREALPEDKPVAVRETYRALGIDYLSIDVDGSFGSEYFDLNTFAPPLKWRAAFDLVNNEGTIEHLINPINGFQIAHELLKVGGVAVHSMPLTGRSDHGLMCPTVYSRRVSLGLNAGQEEYRNPGFVDFPLVARIVRALPKKAGESPGLRAATRRMALLG